MFFKLNHFPSTYIFLIALLFILCGQANGQEKTKSVLMPVKYDEHRFYVQPITLDGAMLTFYTDTGGGLFIYKDVIERLKLEVNKISQGGQESIWTKLPKFKPNALIPEPLGSDGKLFGLERPKNETPALDVEDGMLGQAWFAGRIWTFDYSKKQLILWETAPDIFKGKSDHIVTLGFKTDGDGKRILNFPRIQVLIDGETLDLLFDTGATTHIKREALTAIKDNGAQARATSFITTSVFEKWRKNHPDWRVVEKAESKTEEAMIEVPKVTIAGYSVGPVWFTRRADKNFHEFMSGFMDKRVEGAIGGNALRYFRITVDYPNARAIFERK